MNAELIQAWAAVFNALAWPVAIIFVIYILRGFVVPAVAKGGTFRFKVRDIAEFLIEPAKGLRPPSTVPHEDRSQLTRDVDTAPQAQEKIPIDYFFLNHTSFLRKDKQNEFRRRTGVPLEHFDIRVIFDSYYRGALDRIEQVKYILHSAYPHPIQIRRNPRDKFQLKELANGEYVLAAEVFLKDQEKPVLLQRYITLWESGPRLDAGTGLTGVDVSK